MNKSKRNSIKARKEINRAMQNKRFSHRGTELTEGTEGYDLSSHPSVASVFSLCLCVDKVLMFYIGYHKQVNSNLSTELLLLMLYYVILSTFNRL